MTNNMINADRLVIQHLINPFKPSTFPLPFYWIPY